MLTATQAAKDIFEKYARSIPVNPVAIAQEMGMIVKKSSAFDDGEFSSYCGVAYIEDGKQYIIFNGDDPLPRQRFTIAHEIGHHVLGHTKTSARLRDPNFTDKSPIETAANNFAAELLVPMEILEIAIGDDLSKSRLELSEMFGVSEAVMSIRLERFYKHYLEK